MNGPDTHSQGENVSKVALETSLFINSSNPTIVGVWDLKKPRLTESANKRIRLRGNESLDPQGDRRARADDSHITPPGQYKAICKLFMTYVNGAPDEFIGTGWLISDDILVTAGHCLYEWEYQGGFLKEIKCFFGYHGSSSPGVYRYGVTAAIPGEYLKAKSAVHDVSFIRLNEPVNDIPFIKYSNTPIQESAELGVAGFPGDLNFGEQMYEHWSPVNIDLAKTGTLLSYTIDTNQGQSGAPVLRKLQNGQVDAIGVHISAGLPNTGSVIGPVGNRFEEYILALNVRGGYTTSTATTITSLADPTIPSFQMITIKPTPAARGGRNGVHQASPSLSGISSPSAVGAYKDYESALNNLFGRDPRPDRATQSADPVASGTLTHFPESLRLESDKLPPAGYDKAIAKAKEQDDIRTVFFVNFSSPLTGELLKKQQDLMDSIETWQAWASSQCEAKVQQLVDAKKLPDDSQGQFARSVYRAKVFDYLFRAATWFAKTADENMEKHIEVKKLEFHSEILTTVLEGYSIPATVFSSLEKVLKQIANGISLSSNTGSEAQQYWIMMTKYNYEETV